MLKLGSHRSCVEGWVGASGNSEQPVVEDHEQELLCDEGSQVSSTSQLQEFLLEDGLHAGLLSLLVDVGVVARLLMSRENHPANKSTTDSHAFCPASGRHAEVNSKAMLMQCLNVLQNLLMQFPA